MRIIEACHYYLSVGFTENAQAGLKEALAIKQEGDSLMLFIDDVHTEEQAPLEERTSRIIQSNLRFEYTVYESEMIPYALEALEALLLLSRKKRAKKRGSQYFCSGFPITSQDGSPNCVLLDLGLCIYKKRLGYMQGVNILPEYYRAQQDNLHRLLKKMNIGFTLETIYYSV